MKNKSTDNPQATESTHKYKVTLKFLKSVGFCALVAFGFLGCASSKGTVTSKRDPSFEGTLQRVLVACPDKRTSAPLGNQFASRFLSQLTNSLAQHGVPASSVDLDSEALDNNSVIDKAANRFHAGQVLGWSLGGVNTFYSARQNVPGDMIDFRSSTAVNLEFGVYDVWVNRLVWRARLSFQISPQPETVANQLIEELIKAELLDQQSPQQNR